MTIMNWDQSLDVGVEKMNDEHKGLLVLMNKLHDLYENGETGSAILTTMRRLGAATAAHFKDEEEFMQSIGYDRFDSHKRIHTELLQRYGDFMEKAEAAGGKVDDEFFKFLKFWLSAHIKGIDVKYGEFANSHVRQAS